MKNNDIINDFILKKLKSTCNGRFNPKNYNENLSEFVIFFYLTCSIFFKSDLYKKFIRLEYEPKGANNKKFEYSFVFEGNKHINVEVKALDCDPLSKDSKLFGYKHDGDVVFKSFFPGCEINKDEICIELDAKEISSNYRQVKKNLKRISDKCICDENNINLGFIIINYATSREEFISYLLHPKHGIFNKTNINTDSIDNIIIFSLCPVNTLMFDEVYENEHILSFVKNSSEEKDEIYEKLRLDNYVLHNGEISDGAIMHIMKECGVYKLILRNNMCTFVQYEMDDKFINSKLEEIKNYKRII